MLRYRRLSYRYAVGLTAGEPRPLGEPWHMERARAQLAQTCWRPPADIFESTDSVTVTVDLAGIDPDELDVLLYEDAVVVEGSRRPPSVDGAGRYHSAEIRQGPFRLELSLPGPIDTQHAVARYERGFLQMSFPKAEGSDLPW